MYLRTYGKFAASAAQDLAPWPHATESPLRQAVKALPGCRSFRLDVGTGLSYLVATSLRDSFEAAGQMRKLPEKLALRTKLDGQAHADDGYVNDDGAIRLADTAGRAEEPDRDASCGLLEGPGRTS